MTEWERVPLGEVIRHRKEFITIDDLTTYKRCRVQVRAQGIVLRDEVPGSAIKTKKQQVCRAGEFLVAEIDAKMGGFGIVPPELEGAVVSSHYFLFEVDEAKLDRDFLDLYSKTPEFMEQVSAQGSTNYAAIRPTHVLNYTMPLPPLPEQQRIVARVKGLLAKVEEAGRLANERDEMSQRLLHSVFMTMTADAPTHRLGEVAPLVRRPIEVVDGKSYAELGVRSFGRGTFHKPNLSALDVGTKKLFGIEPGDLLFNIVFAWEGAVAVAQPEDAGRVGSHRFLTCVANPDMALPDFLNFYFQTPQGLADLGTASPGGAGRNRTLSLKNVALLPVPIPDIQQQQHFVSLLNQIVGVGKQREDLQPQLQALPSSILAQAFAGTL